MIPARHLYIHYPFCRRRCPYCGFFTLIHREGVDGPYLELIGRELELQRQAGHLAPRLSTLFLGGGTPSLWGEGGVARLREVLEKYVHLGDLREWTLEVNPGTVSQAMLEAWRRAGVTRLCIGAQSFDDRKLRVLGRDHTADETRTLLRLLREVRFPSVSLDLIFAVPGHDRETWAADLEEAVAWSPDHISIYGLTLEAGTPFARWHRAGRLALPEEGEYEEEYLMACHRLRGAGYRQYEVSNFARSGQESRHNQAYWRLVPYLGVGPSAHSAFPPRRWWNVADLEAYRSALGAGQLPIDGTEEVEGPSGTLERLYLGLRQAEGVSLDDVSAGGLIPTLVAEGRAEVGEGRLRLTPRGFLVLEEIIPRLAAGPLDRVFSNSVV